MKRKFGEKPYLSKEVGAFKFDFFYKEGNLKRCYLRISNDSGLFTLRIAGNNDTYGYLLTAAMKEREDQLHGYATLLTVTMLSMMQDQQFVKDIEAVVNAHMQRKFDKGELAAKKVTAAKEEGSQALMTEIANEISNK